MLSGRSSDIPLEFHLAATACNRRADDVYRAAVVVALAEPALDA